jgi:bacteriorhodopsin
MITMFSTSQYYAILLNKILIITLILIISMAPKRISKKDILMFVIKFSSSLAYMGVTVGLQLEIHLPHQLFQNLP